MTFGDIVGVAAKGPVSAAFNYRPQLLAVDGFSDRGRIVTDQHKRPKAGKQVPAFGRWSSVFVSHQPAIWLLPWARKWARAAWVAAFICPVCGRPASRWRYVIAWIV
jgi:hypothetical protein